jgi:hypothetical protein
MSDTFDPLTERLRLLREDATYHWIGLVVAIVLGLLLSAVHWVGLVVGGALVGLVASSLRRALLAGLGFGILAVLVWLALLAGAGSLGKVLATGRLIALAVGMGIVAPVLGSLARGVV